MRPKNQRLSLWVIMLSHSSAVQHHKLLVRLNLTESPTRIQPNPTESRKSNKLQWIQIVSNRWNGNIFRDKPPSERALQQLIFHKLTYEYKDPEPWSLAWTDTSWRSSLSDYGGAWWLYVGLAPGHSGTVWLQTGVAPWHSGTVWLQAGVARKNPVGCFLSGCGDQCIAEHLSESATQLVVDQAWEADMLLGSCPPRALLPPHDADQVPTPSPKLESIERPPRPPPLYILMSSISSHWTIPLPLTHVHSSRHQSGHQPQKNALRKTGHM